MRITVIDDDANQATALAMLLRLEGIIATSEVVATTALARLSVAPPDAIVVDVKMPVLSGTKLLAAVRTQNPTLPAVFLTGYEAHDPHLEAALTSERVAYLPKPVDLPRLLETLARLLDERATPSMAGAGP